MAISCLDKSIPLDFSFIAFIKSDADALGAFLAGALLVLTTAPLALIALFNCNLLGKIQNL